jgi:hypothetical protein
MLDELGWGTPRRGIQFPCHPERCAAIRQAFAELIAIAQNGRAAAQPAAPTTATASRPEPAPPHPSVPDIIARINALTERRDYLAPDGTVVVSLRYTTALNAGSTELLITRTAESFSGSTVTTRAVVPAFDVSVVRFPVRPVTYGRWPFEVHEEGLGCQGRKACIRVSTSQASRAYEGTTYECEPGRCGELRQALQQLLAALRAPAPTPAPPESVGPTRLQQSAEPMTRRVNGLIDRSPWNLPAGGVTVTAGVTVTPDAKIAVLTRLCAPGAERDPRLLETCRSAAASADDVVQFSPAESDPGSIGLRSQGDRFLIMFSCRTEGACIRSPDGRVRLRGFGIACPGPTECNQLVSAFSALLDFVDAREPRP